MNLNEFRINIRENFSTTEDDKTESIYQREFSHYSGEKLSKVWEAVRRYHKQKYAPNMAQILEYMEKAGISEQRQNKNVFYNLCQNCNTSFPVKTIACPVCSWRLKKKVDNFYLPAKTPIVVIKATEYPSDMKYINSYCPACSKFMSHTLPMGAKCEAWGTHDITLKTGKPCDTCPCRSCCNDKGTRAGGENVNDIIKNITKKNKYYDNVDNDGVIPVMRKA